MAAGFPAAGVVVRGVVFRGFAGRFKERFLREIFY